MRRTVARTTRPAHQRQCHTERIAWTTFSSASKLVSSTTADPGSASPSGYERFGLRDSRLTLGGQLSIRRQRLIRSLTMISPRHRPKPREQRQRPKLREWQPSPPQRRDPEPDRPQRRNPRPIRLLLIRCLI